MTIPDTQSHILSKSTFLMGCQCPKKLWLYRKKPELRAEVSASQQMVFEKGTGAGRLAQQLFPGGKDASPVDPFHYSEAIRQTFDWIKAGEKIIYEAAFRYDRVMAALDILVNKKGKWYAYEVKSSTGVKDYQLTDAALQYYVMTHAGMRLEDIFIIHINNEYTRKGALDLKKLFKVVSVKSEVLALQKSIPGKINELKKILLQNKEPDIDIGPHCHDPFACDFTDYCWHHIPEVSIFNLTRLTGNKKFDLYYKGIIGFQQLPDGFSLTSAQELQVKAHLDDYVHIEPGKIRTWLRQLKYPLYFMDFETFTPAVPLYDNSKPYQHIPFQFSVHIQRKHGSELSHLEFLGTAETDPRPEFIKRLLTAVDGKGTVLVYNKTFETTRLKELNEAFPEYKKQIDNLLDRTVDLMEPFQQRWFYTAEMNGSYSIKSVLPALVPEMSYYELEIGDGEAAMAAFESLTVMTDKTEREKIRKALLEYCKLDTQAMVKILEKLQAV
jgi:hypothetical protein